MEELEVPGGTGFGLGGLFRMPIWPIEAPGLAKSKQLCVNSFISVFKLLVPLLIAYIVSMGGLRNIPTKYIVGHHKLPDVGP